MHWHLWKFCEFSKLVLTKLSFYDCEDFVNFKKFFQNLLTKFENCDFEEKMNFEKIFSKSLDNGGKV